MDRVEGLFTVLISDHTVRGKHPYGGGSGGGRCRGGSIEKLGCVERNSATRVGWDQR